MASDPPDRPGPDDDPDAEFWALARRVRNAAAEELAEIEWETDRAEEKRQDLTARSVRAMMEGERWNVSFGSRLVDAIVVHAAQDFVGLQDRAGNLHDVHVEALSLITVTGVDPGQGRAPITFRPATFRARLLSFEQVREVELESRRGDWSLRGLIESVNVDHVVVHDRSGQVAVAPIDAIGSISRTPRLDRRGRAQRPPQG